MLRPALLLLGLVGILALGGASGGALGETPESTPSPSPSPALEASPTPVPVTGTPAPTLPTASPPLPYPGSLHRGDWVQVSGTGDCLNVRASPGLTIDGSDPAQPMPVLNCLPDGFIGWLAGWPGDTTEMPVFKDGHW